MALISPLLSFTLPLTRLSPTTNITAPLRCKSIASTRPSHKRARAPWRCCIPGPRGTDNESSKPPPPLFEMRHVSYHPPRDFLNMVLQDLSFRIDAGEFVVVVGANGAGKSSVINVMLGLSDTADDLAQFFWKGEPVFADDVLTHSGVVLQDPIRYMAMPTVLAELTLGRPDVTPADVRAVLRAVNLTDVSLRANPQSLSGGQVRRLAIATQLLSYPRPQLLVLDEPLAGVDWTSRRSLVNTLSELKKSSLAIMLVSHDPGELLAIADRVVEVSRKQMFDVDPAIVRRAVEIRQRRRAERREAAYRAAQEYREQNAASTGTG